MRKLNIAWILAAVLIFSACSRGKSELASYIPKDAVVAVRFNMANLYKDGKFSQFPKTQTFKQISDFSAMLMPELPAILRSIGENSDATGMDMKSDAFLMATKKSVAFILPMKSESDFLKFAKKTISSTGAAEPKKVGSYLTSMLNNGTMLVGWDSKAIFFVGMTDGSGNPQSLEQEFTSITKLDSKNSISSLPIYKDFMNPEKDLLCLFSSETYQMILSRLNMPGLAMIGKGSQLLMALNFGTDKITCDTKMIFGDKNDTEIFSKMGKRGFDSRLLDFLPDTSTCVVTSSMNIAQFTKLIAKMESTVKNNNNNKEKQTGIISIFDLMQRNLSKLTGDVMVAIPTITIHQASGLPEPVNVWVFGTNGPVLQGIASDLSNVAKKNPEFSIVKNGNIYTIKVPKFGNCYVAEKNNAVILSTNASYMNVVLAGKFGKTLSSSSHAAELKTGFGYLTLNPEKMPSEFKNYIQNDNFYSSIFKVFAAFDEVTLSSDFSNCSTSVSLNFKKSGENSLYKIISMIEKSLTSDIATR